MTILVLLALMVNGTPDTFVYRISYENGDNPAIDGPSVNQEIHVCIGDRVRFQPEDPNVTSVIGRKATRRVTVRCTTDEKKRSCGFFRTCWDPICGLVSRDVTVEYDPVLLSEAFHPSVTISVPGQKPMLVRTGLVADQYSGDGYPTLVMPSDGIIRPETLSCNPGYFWKVKQQLPASEEFKEKQMAWRNAIEAGEDFCLDMPEQCRYQKKYGEKGCCQIEKVEDDVTAVADAIHLVVLVTVERW